MKTLIELFEQSVAKFPNNPFLWEKTKDKYQPSTYREIQEQVHQFGAGLLSKGLEMGDRVGLLSEGRNAWLVSELGILYCNAINVPLSVKLEPSELKFRLEHSGAKMVIVSGQQAEKIESIRQEVPSLEKVIYIDGKENQGPNDLSYDDLIKEGKAYLNDPEKKATFDLIWQGIQPDDLANISYTSGTTADPKGIMLSHLNYAANVAQSNSLMDIDESFRTLAILPWDHSFAHTACLYSFMVNGASIGSVQIGRSPMETLRNVPNNIKELRPNIMMSVPALSKNFRKNIEKNIQAKGKTAEKLFKQGLKVAYAYNGDGWNKGKGWRAFMKPAVAFYDKILFSKIREAFGGELKFFVGGGALLDIELQRFFAAIGVPVCQGYGLSEASPVISSNALHAIKFGSSGRLVKDLELKISDDEGKEVPIGEKGEIVIKGDNVMVGYWKNPKASAETLKDGWLHTGDMGYMSKDGFLYVLGRFKSLLIGNDGEKFSPEGIEEALVDQSEFIDQAMLYNNQNPYTSGMLVPNIAAINRKLQKMNIEPGTEEGNQKTLEIIKQEVDAYRKGGKYEGEFPERWLPTTIAVLPEAFTEQNHLMNSTMKMVRGKITEYFSKELEFLYTAEARNIINPMNMEAVAKWNGTL
ncbi:AMP-dependent synthetase [Prolixibacter bellariivorans]|uniref:AMP-dependent synthetase n=1 Tax=Prolixibacter bellariivorans TaxID=314319 RepID=A0A5M4B0E3_9BACT|nr:AMP-binding protein [Prolixibacter bellariivorans]GET33438.1 AMP-dependent synthetase [Prolixibacter bellariivorans]